MQVQIVVSHYQRVAFLPEVTPVEGHVGVGETVRKVRHTLFIGDIVCAVTDGRFLVVADIHLRIVSTPGSASSQKAVTGGDVIAFGQHLAVVDVACRLFAAAQVGDVTLDIVFGVAVNQTAFHIYVMFVECFVVADIQVQVVAVFSGLMPMSPISRSSFPNIFLDGRQAVGFFHKTVWPAQPAVRSSTGGPVPH